MKTLSVEEEELLELSIKVIDLVFKKHNITVCSNCPDVKRYNKEFGKTQKHRTKDAGCCAECAKYNGFFDSNQIRLFPKELIKLKEQYCFDKIHGFFDISNHCCKLPRIVRSSTCLKHCCNIKYEQLATGAVSTITEIKGKHNMLY